ncbi:GntR family transcriptional regulator [Microbacterium ulmi]|uniref:GntR family transcriptional regulator n=1 Tax=Microbacterium ulmi TaxID=179095 RepID=A0A7Y2M1U9_9MICO|nr:GntR family transcriptional regulator [Microbacterium ulmi]NII69272.1 DNA-binding GntR family transcriptional regulator [Microbacterium ulmi]NNH04951.1 GntR family transcriptional regulator [Microbacterium ulmi]
MSMPVHVADARTPMGAEIYEALLSRILVSDLGPGDRLTIDALAREFGVSQTPVREALHRLDAEGIVVRNHLAGYRVGPTLTRDEFEDLVEVRLLLEPAAARRGAERMSPEGVRELVTLADEMSRLDREREESPDRYARYSVADGRFHDTVAAGSGNDYLRSSLARLHPHVHLFRLSRSALVTADAIAEHQAIIDAIASRDPDAAAYAMRVHIETSARRFRSSFPKEST